jgi:hypothetical protein
MPFTNGLDDEVAGFVFPIFFDIGIHDTQHADGPKLEAHIEATAIPADLLMLVADVRGIGTWRGEWRLVG